MMRKLTLLSMLFGLSSISFAACNTTNVYESIECYEKQLKAAKTELNQTYQKIYKSLDNQGKIILEHSQIYWLTYKNHHCDELVGYLASQYQGGGSQLVNLSCNTDLTKDRIKQLKDTF